MRLEPVRHSTALSHHESKQGKYPRVTPEQKRRYALRHPKPKQMGTKFYQIEAFVVTPS
jgi:uncharacterized protein YdeI (YjbR/CyaY-like superfamily)